MWRTFDVGGMVEALGENTISVAGAGGMTRSVQQARMAASVEQLLDVSAHDVVVVTANVVVAAHGSTGDLIAFLGQRDVGALVVRLDADYPLPVGLLEVAERESFPVVTFPPEIHLSSMTTEILNALLHAQRQRLDRVLEIHSAFTEVGLSAGGIPEIASLLFKLLGRPIAVIDEDKDLIAAQPEDHSVWSAPAIRGEDGSIARHPIVAGAHVYGEIVVDTYGSPLDHDQEIALQRASVAIAVRLAHAQAASTELDRFAALSLEELISGRADDIADVAERAASFGWNLKRRRAVLLASIDPPTDLDTAPRSLVAIAAAARATLGPDAIVWTRAASVAALLALDSDDLSERRHCAEMLRAELDRTVRSVTVSVGVGRCVYEPLSLPRSYLEASRSVDVGRWVKGRHATEVYDDLGLERLLASASADDLAEFVEHAIGPLVDHDRSNATELVATLETWLETRNMAESARRLFVHYNTLKNRLDRIEGVLGPVLEDPARSLECQVAVHVYRHYDGPWTDG